MPEKDLKKNEDTNKKEHSGKDDLDEMAFALNLLPKKYGKNWIHEKKESVFYVIDIIFNGIIIFGLVIFIRYFLISPFQVSGQSMCNTLNFVNGVCLTQRDIGEYIIVDKLSYRFGETKRGDIIVFVPPMKGNEFYVKRIIGLPGEKVQIKDGKVWLKKNDASSWEVLEENYLNEKNQGRTFIDTPLSDYVFEVPKDEFFVLGDNRNGSSDSRHWRDQKSGAPKPYVEGEQIEGKVWLVLWPFNNMRIL